MSAVTEQIAVRRTRPPGADNLVPLVMILGATALTCVMNAGQIAATWHGHFWDPDDAMRLVEVRTWLAGQSWFDMNAARLDPPHGSVMHWSRLVDLPLALMVRLFGLATDIATAERLAAIAVPTLWLVALYVGMARLAERLVGRAGRLPVTIGMVLSGATLVQFGPGRVGHHAPETVTLVFAVGAAIAALDPRRAWEAFATGALVAFSLAMSLETLPFFIALIGALVFLWVWQGQALSAMLTWLAAGLLVTLPVVFLLTVSPQTWGTPVCDAYGAAHLGAGLIGAFGLLGLARLTLWLHGPVRRMIAAGIAAILVITYVAIAYPACLRSPFAGVDPLVRALWLDHVIESFPLPAFMSRHEMLGLAIVIPIVLGLLGHLIAMFVSSGLAASRFAVLALLSACGLALAFWQVRVLASVTPLALCGGVYLAVRLQQLFAARRLTLAAAVAPGAVAFFTSTVWAVALPSDSPGGRDTTAACLTPKALAPLAGLPPGAAVAPINAGSHILVATGLSVFAAPYHRNNDGNLFTYKLFMAPPAEAATMLAERKAAYVIICPGMADLKRLQARAPDGLAARLARGDIPAYLSEQHLGATPYKAYAVRPAPL